MFVNRSKCTAPMIRSRSSACGLWFFSSHGCDSSHAPPPFPRPSGVSLSDGSTLPGDLIIDASGRGSKAADWIAAAGYTAPELQVVNCETWYTTAVYELDQEFVAKEAPVVSWWALETYPSTRTALVFPIEGGKRWQVGSYLGALVVGK